MRDAETNLKYLKNTYEQPFTGEVDPADLQSFVDKFIAAMDEDINAANGITVVFELAKWINSGHYDQDVKDALAKMLEVFGVVFVEEVLDADIEALIAERQEARAKKDFARADAIRDELAAQGIKLLDTKEGVRWTRDWCQSNQWDCPCLWREMRSIPCIFAGTWFFKDDQAQ